MKSYCVLLGGLIVAVGAMVMFLLNAIDDPVYLAIGNGLGMIFILGGMV